MSASNMKKKCLFRREKLHSSEIIKNYVQWRALKANRKDYALAARVILLDFKPWLQVVAFYFIINNFLSSSCWLGDLEGEEKIIG